MAHLRDALRRRPWRKIEATGTTGTADSDETYLLVTAADASSAIVKIRFDLMDIKLLREVDADGLERWEPVLKVGFPMPAADVERVIEALQLPAATLAREAYTLQQFLDEVAGPSGMVRPVEVHKHRVRYTVGGCSSEVSDVIANGKTIRTIAIESDGCRRRGRGGPLGRPGRLCQHELPARARGAPRRPARALRGHRRGHQLDQVPGRRARRRWAVPRRRRPRRGHPPRPGDRRGRRDRPRGARAGRSSRSTAWPTRRRRSA